MAEAKKAPTKVKTGKMRAFYANVFVPKAVEEGQDPKYSVTLVWSKKDKLNTKVMEAAVAAAKKKGMAELWSGKAPEKMKKFHFAINDGDDEDDTAYHGKWFIRASSKNKPGIVDQDRDLITSSDDFYSGVWCRASLNCYPYMHKTGGAGISWGLNALQKVADGERLSGGVDAETEFDDDFDDFEEEEDEKPSKGKKKPVVEDDEDEDDDDEDLDDEDEEEEPEPPKKKKKK